MDPRWPKSTFCECCREIRTEKKRQKMNFSSRNARKPNSLFKNWHTRLLITSDSKNSLWSQKLCQRPVYCVINAVKNENGWLLVKRIKKLWQYFLLYNGTQTDFSIKGVLKLLFKKFLCCFHRVLAQLFYQENNHLHFQFCEIKI